MAGKGASGPLLAVGAIGAVFVLAFAMVILAVVGTPPAGACGPAAAAGSPLAGGGGVVGASEYGGAADPTSGIKGAYGLLPGHYAFAELSTNPNAGLANLDFKALGGLAPHTLLQVTYNGKSLIAEKLDVGAGGGLVNGHPRVIDLWYQTAQALGFAGTGLVQIAPAPPGTPASAALVGGTAAATPGAPTGSSPSGSCPAGTGGPQQVAATPGSYYNPLRGIAGLVPKQIDQGVDYAGSGPIYAVGDGVVLSTTNSGWPGGAFIAIRLTDGPATGAVVFTAENITPSVAIGQQVTANTVIGTLHNSFPNMEIGWGSATPGTALAQAYGGDVEGRSTQLGLNFSQLLTKLGAPPGVINPIMGTLPAGWPTW